MKTQNYEAYRVLRAQGQSASSALHYLRIKPVEILDWESNRQGNSVSNFDRDGFKIKVELVPDDHADSSWIGTYTDKWEAEAIERRDRERHTYKYFVPTNSYSAHFQGLRALNYGKAESDLLARSYVKRDFEQMEKINSGDIQFVGIVVKAYRNGIRLGDASCWGFELDNYSSKSEAYINSSAEDLIAEAISDAKSNREALCSDID
jgi:hypothetical protein